MAWKHLMELIGVLIILWFVWFFTGGPERTGNNKPFIKPLPPVNTGEKYGPQ